MHTIQLVQHANVFTLHYENEITISRRYMTKDWAFKLCHALKAICVLTFLTKLGTRSMSDLLFVFDYPAELCLLLTTNSVSVAYHYNQ